VKSIVLLVAGLAVVAAAGAAVMTEFLGETVPSGEQPRSTAPAISAPLIRDLAGAARHAALQEEQS
jgi:hypothetical protein